MKKSLSKVFVVFSLIFLVSNIYANEKQMELLNNNINIYFDALKKSDVNTMVNYIYEPSFELMPKKNLISSFEQMFQNEKVPKISEINNIKSDSIKKYKKGFFTKTSYFAKLNMKSPSKEPDEIKSFISVLENMLKEKKPKISYDKKSANIVIEINTYVLSINEDDKGWKFVADNFIDNLQKANLLPEEISNSIKKN